MATRSSWTARRRPNDQAPGSRRAARAVAQNIRPANHQCQSGALTFQHSTDNSGICENGLANTRIRIAVLLNTYAWVWSLFPSASLSDPARKAVETAQTVLAAPCSFHEITHKHRLGKWPEVSDIVERLPHLLRA